MKRLVLAIFAIFSFSVLSIGSEFNFNTYKATLLKVENGYGQILNDPSIIIGSSGVVMHTFKNGESSIIARAVVTEKSGTLAKVRFEVFDMVSQEALPVPGLLPVSGDEVVLNFLYKRALIVVPNKEIYDEVVNHFKDVSFVHPDIIGAYLSYDYKPNPSRDDFRKMCSQSSAGLIFIALNGESVFADCGSFKVLKSFKSGKVAYYQLPFYTNVRDIKAAFWDFNNGKINDYDKHYRYLLEEDKDE